MNTPDTDTVPVPVELLRALRDGDPFQCDQAIEQLAQHIPRSQFEPSRTLTRLYLDWWEAARKLDREAADDLRSAVDSGLYDMLAIEVAAWRNQQ